MNILVTGGAGFIGGNLTKRLIEEGHRVTITAMGGEPIPAGVRKVLYCSLTGIEWKYIEDQDAVFHLAANNDTLCDDEREMMKANYFDSCRLFGHVINEGCQRIVYASSTAVYGNSPAPYTEDTPTETLNQYAISKLRFDKIVLNGLFDWKNIPRIGFGQRNIAGLRFCNVYGPGEENKSKRMSMVGQLVRTMILGEPTLFEFGEQRRDWVHVQDVVEACILAMNKNVGTNIYNIGSGHSWTFNEMVDIIKNELIERHPERRKFYECLKTHYAKCPFADKYQIYTECKIEKAQTNLGFSPKFDLRSGVKSYLDFLDDHCE